MRAFYSTSYSTRPPCYSTDSPHYSTSRALLDVLFFLGFYSTGYSTSFTRRFLLDATRRPYSTSNLRFGLERTGPTRRPTRRVPYSTSYSTLLDGLLDGLPFT